jgi:methionyl-tRNA synthetase
MVAKTKTEKRLVTAALPYINNVPHLGHIAGSHLPADVFARFCRSKGYDTLFIGGSDENGTPCEIASEELKIDIHLFLKTLHKEHKKIYNWFGISYDNFTRTSSDLHAETVVEFFKELEKNKCIKEDFMEVFYSAKENRYLPDRYVKGTCKFCGYTEASGDQCEKCSNM